MKVVPRDRGYDMQDEQGHDSRFAKHERQSRPLPRDAMRSWLVSGIHLFVVDPRRRFGGHARAKELLVVDRRAWPGVSERWQTLLAALHRHTVHDGMSQLSPEERRVLTLAYLEGRTNHEIAAMSGVSVSTVRRRLSVALQRLDEYVNRTGAWLAARTLGRHGGRFSGKGSEDVRDPGRGCCDRGSRGHCLVHLGLGDAGEVATCRDRTIDSPHKGGRAAIGSERTADGGAVGDSTGRRRRYRRPRVRCRFYGYLLKWRPPQQGLRWQPDQRAATSPGGIENEPPDRSPRHAPDRRGL